MYALAETVRFSRLRATDHRTTPNLGSRYIGILNRSVRFGHSNFCVSGF